MPDTISLGERIALTFTLTSTSNDAQRLIIDYAIHYVKKSGGTSAKVFKLKTLELAASASVTLRREQEVRNFTTRVHYAGRHDVDVLINGECLGRSGFVLNA
jgi:hypothetical protein